MIRTNNDNNIKKKQCLLALFLSKCVNLLKKYPFDFNMFKYFRIDNGQAVKNEQHPLSRLGSSILRL